MAAPHHALLPLIRGDELPPGTRITTEVVASAEEHGVAALVDAEVTRRGIDVGPDLRTRLAMSAMAAMAEHQAAEQVAAVVAHAAASLGIRVGVFKGVAIGHRFYPKPYLRPTIDVDVFVDPSQLHRMGELAAALGARGPERDGIDAMVAEGRVFEHTIDAGITSIDLHRDPMNMVLPTRSEHERWATMTAVDLPNGPTMATLDLEWTILQALLHAFRDNFADLLHIYDLDLMFDADPDWGRIAAIAAAEGWTDITRYAIAFVCDALGRTTPLPRRTTRASLLLIRKVWPDDLLLKGADSIVTSHRRQSALSLLTTGRRSGLVSAYTRRVVPPRDVIDVRTTPSDDPYAVALVKWRLEQRRRNTRMKHDAQTRQGNP